MRVKISEATNLQIDWMVAKCEGYEPEWDENDFWLEHPTLTPCWLTNTYEPSTDWSQGGPIIEQKGISVMRVYKDWPHPWCAELGEQNFTNAQTPLIAAMRCYVASKLGNEVDIPEELK